MYLNTWDKDKQNYNNIHWNLDEQPCLVAEFFKREAEKPEGLRSRIAMISCPCKLCTPYCM